MTEERKQRGKKHAVVRRSDSPQGKCHLRDEIKQTRNSSSFIASSIMQIPTTIQHETNDPIRNYRFAAWLKSAELDLH
jgi:hypothetical protein